MRCVQRRTGRRHVPGGVHQEPVLPIYPIAFNPFTHAVAPATHAETFIEQGPRSLAGDLREVRCREAEGVLCAALRKFDGVSPELRFSTGAQGAMPVASRVRRKRNPRVPPALSGKTGANNVDDVKKVALSTYSIKRRYSVADVLKAVGAGARPFSSLATCAIELSAIADGEGLKPSTRRVLRNIADTLDLMTDFIPAANRLKAVAYLAGTVGRLVDGETLTAADLIQLNEISASMLRDRTEARSKAPSAPRDFPGKSRASKGLVRSSLESHRKHDEAKVSGKGWVEGNKGAAHFQKEGEDDASVIESDSALVPFNFRRSSHMVDKMLQQRKAEKQALEMIAEAPDEGEAILDAGREPPPAAKVHENIQRAADKEGAAVSGGGEGVPGARGADAGSAADAVLTKPAYKAFTDAENAFFLKIAKKRSFVRDAQFDRWHATVKVGDVPIEQRMDPASGELTWAQMPLEDYAVNIIAPADAPPIFTQDGVEFVCINGESYPVRELQKGRHFIVKHDADASLPPVPIELDSNADWQVKRPPSRSRVDIKEPVAADGFIRVNNKRYVRLEGKTYEANRARIIDEVRISAHARAETQALGAVDEMGVILTSDGRTLIEGELGYYVLFWNNDLGRSFVGDPQGGELHAVEFDDVSRRWIVTQEGRTSAVPGEAPSDARDSFDSGIDVAPPSGESADGAGGAASPQSPDSARSPSGPRSPVGILLRTNTFDSIRFATTKFSDLEFLSARPKLRKRLEKVFAGISDLGLSRSNRDAVGGKGFGNIGEMRETIYEQVRQIKKWDTFSVLKQQRSVARITAGTYGVMSYLELDSTAFCNELTDLLLDALTRESGYKPRLLEVQFREVPGSGATHVALLYSDHADLQRIFGNVYHAYDPAQPPLTMSRQVFAEKMLESKRTMAIFDLWAGQKVLDFSSLSTADEVAELIDGNLAEANFGRGVRKEYQVSAVVPSRGKHRDSV